MSKIAAGTMQTHVAGSQVDMALLASIADESGASNEVAAEIGKANTARHVQEIAAGHNLADFWNVVARKVCEACDKNVQGTLTVECILTDFEGNILGKHTIDASA